MSLRVKWADGLWATEVMNFDPELLKDRGMVLASEGERKRQNKSQKRRRCIVVCMCVCVCVREMLTYEGLFGDDVLCHLKERKNIINNRNVSGSHVG